MMLQRILALAVLGCAMSTASAYDFDDAETETSNAVPNDESRIYGGEEADVTQYPWTVSLRKTPEGQTYCGGTLVASQYIVTAAHCVKDTTYASIGSQYSTGTEGGERIKVAQQWIHPKYEKASHVYDVAVMKLEKASTAKTLPLCKADGSQNEENAMAVVRGWGVTEKETPSKTLLEVNVKIISNAVCNKSYNNRITEQMICAGTGGGKDTCQGDSGGALISSNALVGIVSWGGACGEAPGVYVRVTSVLDFINEKIGGGAATNGTDASGSAGSASATPLPSATVTRAPSNGAAITTTAPTSATPEAGSASQYPNKPATSTAAPAAGNAAPAATTAAPAAPAATTAAPAATTAKPAATTAAPAAATPAATTAAPAATTAAPASAGKPAVVPAPGKEAGGKGTSAGKGTGATKPKKKDCGVRL